MAPAVFGDGDVRERLDAATAVRAVRGALVAHHAGALRAPARVGADLGDGAQFVFTVGRMADEGLFGFRAYDTLVDAEQLVAVWGADGRIRTVVHGDELGPRRTGAIGAVAVDVAANPGAVRVGVVGTGPQAWTQIWALCAVRPVEEVVVTSRRPERARAFAERCRGELGLKAKAAQSTGEAVRERDVVLVATDSPEPVFDAGWLSPGTHVSTLGPKTVSRHEVPVELVERADVVLTDSRAQAAAHGEPFLFDVDGMVELGAATAGAVPARTAPEQITVFCSVGLAGTEVAVAAALAAGVHT